MSEINKDAINMWAIPLRLIKCKDHTQKKSPTNSILPLCKVLDTVGKDNPIKISNHAFTFRPIVREIKFLNRKNDAIEKLVRCLNSSDKKTAGAPAIFWNNTNISAFKRGRVSIAEKFSNWIVNGKFGYQPGVISLSGVGFGFYFNGNFQNKIQTEWLPGGCILHRMDNLVTENYFPFSGKAYSEDLIHSLLLKKNEVKLYICNNAIGFIEPIFYPDSLIELYKQYKATKYVVKIRDRGFARLHLFYFFRLIKTIVKLTFKEILRPVKKATK